MYREDWLNRFYAQRRPEGAPRAFAPQRRGSFKNGRFVPTPPPVRDEAKSIATSGIDAPTARALLLGFAKQVQRRQRRLRGTGVGLGKLAALLGPALPLRQQHVYQHLRLAAHIKWYAIRFVIHRQLQVQSFAVLLQLL